MARIFLCHASEDKPQVRDVYRRLAAIEGFEPWLDEEDLLPGQIWADEIPHALKASEFILVFFSRNSVAKRGYVQREMKMALEAWEEIPGNMIHTIPVRLDKCELPEPFGRYHHADLFNPRGFDRLVQGLQLGLEQRGIPKLTLLESPSIESEPPSDNPPPPAAQSRPDTSVILPDELETFTNSISMKFVLIPAGDFTMGSPDSSQQASDHEKPSHRVKISQPFYLGKYPVTQAQWEAVMGNNPSGFPGNPNHPVEHVSWDDVQEFLQKLNALDHDRGYRLPTEAQWEYACRAGTETPRYPGGVDAIAWYAENSDRNTHPVGEKDPNSWGLSDMHGNVWEWVQDRYDGSYYQSSPIVDPECSDTGTYRVLRGGSWQNLEGHVRSACRYGRDPDYSDKSVGFRCAMSVPSK